MSDEDFIRNDGLRNGVGPSDEDEDVEDDNFEDGVPEKRNSTVAHRFLKFSNGDRYEGDFDLKHACYHGHGIFRWASGDVYDGAWVRGKREGEGKFFHNDGSIYMGCWLNNKRDGVGILRRLDGAVYEGPWKDDRMSGEGGVFT